MIATTYRIAGINPTWPIVYTAVSITGMLALYCATERPHTATLAIETVPGAASAWFALFYALGLLPTLVVPGLRPASTSTCMHQPRNVSGFIPVHCPIRITAAFSDSSRSSCRASAISRTDRSRNSDGYFLDAAMIFILSGNQTLH
ncbi:Uncharacterised protein [Mycobacteroides abscessus subsp. abscessus]|uniref:hypothetical protein n=1 Tax=Mycobacteroides abscessus TaxID=36809 RepID=UPI000927B1D2|nr:hypothetical protein [Mycobacteroides abscessus]SIE35963.1 Uncharacterised protein [Mycobacteroides abscessus subsp. abscessus]SKV16411.1 Uncharacterised protein [Mycobacteroides abscessus subsp. abscessus]